MKSKTKYAIIGLGVGGFLPALLHLLKITDLVSVEDVIAHTIGGLVGAATGLVVYRLKNR